jgi:LacI family transcriptional regulator
MNSYKAVIKNIAEKANVSIATVSRALRKNGQNVSFHTRQKILETARFLNYPINGKKTNVNRNIGIISRYLFPKGVIKQQANGFYSTILHDVEKWLRNNQYNTLFSSYEENDLGQIFVPKWITDKTVNGIIIVGKVEKNFVNLLEHNKIPFVIINYTFRDVRYNTVISDNFGGAYNLISYLTGLGHRRIGFIRELTNHPSFDERFRGYQEALTDKGIPVDRHLVRSEEYNPNLGYDSTKTLLHMQDPPTAIFGVNDYIAANVIRAVSDAKLSIPDDVSVVGFDGLVGDFVTVPLLTTARVDVEGMVQQGIERLLRIMNADLSPVNIILSSPVIEGKSCSEPKKHDKAS